jgi:hypothetical protein
MQAHSLLCPLSLTLAHDHPPLINLPSQSISRKRSRTSARPTQSIPLSTLPACPLSQHIHNGRHCQPLPLLMPINLLHSNQHQATVKIQIPLSSGPVTHQDRKKKKKASSHAASPQPRPPCAPGRVGVRLQSSLASSTSRGGLHRSNLSPSVAIHEMCHSKPQVANRPRGLRRCRSPHLASNWPWGVSLGTTLCPRASSKARKSRSHWVPGLVDQPQNSLTSAMVRKSRRSLLTFAWSLPPKIGKREDGNMSRD